MAFRVGRWKPDYRGHVLNGHVLIVAWHSSISHIQATYAVCIVHTIQHLKKLVWWKRRTAFQLGFHRVESVWRSMEVEVMESLPR